MKRVLSGDNYILPPTFPFQVNEESTINEIKLRKDIFTLK